MTGARTRSARELWGGHFASDPAPLMERINASVGFDKRLWAEDIRGSIAHARMLAARGVITEADRDAIVRGLEEIAREIEEGRFVFDPALEDVHLNIEARLIERIGEPGRRLHTARSRNDQVATDLRLWVKAACARVDASLRELQRVLLDRAEEHAATVMPGFTHLQAAQPVTLGHHLLAYVEMFGRDRSRFSDAHARMDECPLGAAALAGTSFPVDREATARELGFARPMANSIDAVSDRDFVLDYLAAAAICAVHLSRLAEELVLWSTPQFGFVRLPETFTSGSSIMPQKRNPDAAELVRGKSGRVIGHLVALLVVLKGLPLAYSKDMQEDKEGLFDAADTLELCAAVAAAMLAEARFDPARMRAAAELGHPTATDLADWLVRVKGVPFREAHGIAARAVRRAEELGCALEELPDRELLALDARIDARVREVLGVERSVASRTSSGGTAPVRVREAIAAARRRFLGEAQPAIEAGG
ncbi:MAG: argininosuccinate lyase [Geminicoccaceae bacterium]|nr:argininosuccinate lyase [Geminicoccaceae bacterium]MCS7268998.1 argininosuccinate lyase [Geminicoccaceae bacterium]MDW8340461.1 argininosuccinate lyase [Geminicoccaceae bacterium]